MFKPGSLFILLAATVAFAAQPATPTPTRHYRLTFVLNYPGAQTAAQTYTLDVPVYDEHRGMAQLSTSSMLTGVPQSSGGLQGPVQEFLLCTDVQESARGLSARVAFSMESSASPEPGSQEAVHQKVVFNRQVDISLRTATLITQPMHKMSLLKGNAVPIQEDKQSAAPQITLTAVEI